MQADSTHYATLHLVELIAVVPCPRMSARQLLHGELPFSLLEAFGVQEIGLGQVDDRAHVLRDLVAIAHHEAAPVDLLLSVLAKHLHEWSSDEGAQGCSR